MHHDLPRHRRHRSALAVGGLALALTLANLAPAAADPTVAAVSLSASPSAEIGDTVLVDVDLTGTTDVYTYEVTLTFDPAVLDYVADSTTGPGGGYTTAAEGTGSVTLVHTRLGTSPALGGDLAASVSFTAVGSGSAAVRATSVTLVDAAGTDLLITPPATATTATEVAAVVVPTPTPTPTPSATPTPPGPTPAPTPTTPTSPTDGAGTATTGASTSRPDATGATGTGSLARTGATIGSVLLIAAAAIAGGVLLVRRRSAGAR